METIKRGSKNESVKQLQEKLNKLGYKLDVDGIFGGDCQNAVTDFQRKQGLDADGVVGSGTWTALEKALKSAAKPPAASPSGTAQSGTAGKMIDKDTLSKIMPNANQADIDRYLSAINAGLARYNINTPLRIAHFIAQIAHESGSFKFSSENLNYSASALRSVFGKYFKTDEEANAYARNPEKIANRVYGGRMGNGDESTGEGWKYRGRGLIQLTGKENYRNCALTIGINIDVEPQKLADNPEAAVLAAGWFWDARKLNDHADKDDVLTITKRINGGTHGLDDRKAYLARAKQALGLA